MYYPCFIYVSILLETTTVYFPVSILWICLCVMYKASIVWTVDSLVGCMDPAFPFMIYVSFWCSKTSLTSSIFRYGCINSFSVWSINSLFLDAIYWSFCSLYGVSIPYFLMIRINHIFVCNMWILYFFMIYLSCIAIECMISTLLYIFSVCCFQYGCINRSL